MMNYKKMITSICEEEKIKCTLISHDWGFVLEKNNKIKYIIGYHFPLNDQAIGSIMDDKYALYDLCHNINIPIIEYQILWNPQNSYGKNTYTLLNNYFNLYNHNVVLKPNLGSQGNDVYHITKKKDLKKISKKLFLKNFSISICPFYDISHEYRVIILDGVPRLSFEKIKSTVIGDGEKSIKELLIELNPTYFSHIDLKKYKKVLKKGEVFTYDWRFNLNKGATARLITSKKLKKDIEDFAVNVTKKLNVRFVSVDIILNNNEFYLMEINAGVCIDLVTNFIPNGEQIAKSIYKDVILTMFKD